jgi:hypothetical protein
MTTKSMAYAGAIVAACACMTARADTDTNQLPVALSVATNRISRTLLEMYAEKFDTAGTPAFWTSLGPLSGTDHLWDMDKGYAFIQKWNDNGQETTGNALGYAFQETVMESLPLDQWKEDSSGTVWNLFVHFFEGSFGDTVEEQVIGHSTSASYATAEPSWRAYLNDKLNGGYRLQKSPYAYVDLPFGRKSGGGRLALIGLRCHSDLMDRENIGAIAVEPHAMAFLFEKVQLQAGMSFHPAQFNETDYKRTWSAGISRINGRIDFSLNFQSSEHGQTVIFGLTETF